MGNLNIAWQLVTWCNFGSLVLLLTAVGIFTQYTIQKMTSPERDLEGKRRFIRAGRTRLALVVFCCGIVLQAGAIVLANILPARP